MAQRRLFILGIVFVILLSATVISCYKSDDDDEGSGGSGKEPPIHFTNAIEAYAVGDVVYRYTNGWLVVPSAVPEGSTPWYSVDFSSPFLGWASGTGKVYRYEDHVWTEDSPPVSGSLILHRIVAPPDGTVWAIGNSGEESGGTIAMRGTDGTWAVTDLDALFSTTTLAKDITVLPSGGVAVLVQANQNAVVYEIVGGAAQTLGVYSFDPANWYTYSAIGVTPAGRLLVGGRLNVGINKTGTILLQDDAGAFQPMTLPETACPLTDCTRFKTIGERTFMIAECYHSVIYYLDGAQWTEMSLPGEKGTGWRLYDFGFLDWTTGWAVGYSDVDNGPLLLLMDEGWQLIGPPEAAPGRKLYGVSVWSSEYNHGTDDTADDDTTADDTTADDTGADDTTADDTV